MSKKQKIILFAFGILDFIVVIILASIIYNASIPYLKDNSLTPLSKCASNYLDSLQDAYHQMTFAADKDTIHLTVKIQGIDDVNPEIVPSYEEATLLWSFLDKLGKTALYSNDTCQDPKLLTIQFITAREPSAFKHLIVISMKDLLAWTQGEMDEELFATSIQYREISPKKD